MKHMTNEAGLIDWYAVRTRPPRNTGRRTVVVDAEYEAYFNRAKQARKRRVSGTGRREYLAEVLLKRAGFEVFMPKREEWRRINPRKPEKTLVAYPKLGNWIFVGWEAGRPRWHDLQSLDLVGGLLGADGRPVRISETCMVRMMETWSAGSLAPEHYRYMRAHEEFEVGDRVRVVDGSWEGFEMDVVDLDGAYAKGIVGLLGKDVEIRLPSRTLAFVGERALKVA